MPRRPVLRSTLLDGLQSWWGLNEASGVRYDAHAANHLTDVNGVGSVVGVVGNGVEGSSDGRYLQRTGATFGYTDAISMAMWLRTDVDTTGVGYGLMMGAINVGQRFQYVAVTSGQNLRYYRSDGSTLQNSLLGVLTVGAWAHVAVSHVGAVVNAWVNGVQVLTNVASVAATTPGNSLIRIAASGARPTRVDETAFWNRGLTGAEVAELYNAGAGRGYPGP